MKGYSAFPKASVLLESNHQIVQCPIQDTHWWGSYPSAEKLSVYSIAPADWTNIHTYTYTYIYMYIYICIYIYIYTGCVCDISKYEWKALNSCWLVGWVLWHINLCRLFNAKSIFIQIISSVSNNSVLHEYTVLSLKHFYFKVFNLFKQF